MSPKEGLRTSHTHTRIGPLPKQQRRPQAEALKLESQRLLEGVKEKVAKIKKFNEKYGEDLGGFARAYIESVKEGKFYINVRDVDTPITIIRAEFAQSLINRLAQQPAAKRADWLTVFLFHLQEVTK